MADVEDDVDNLDDVDDVDYPEDYVDGGELVYGSSADVLIIIPKGEAREWAELQRALYFARTWGQFKSMAPEGRYDEVRRRYHYDDWTPKTKGEEPDEDMPFHAGSINCEGPAHLRPLGGYGVPAPCLAHELFRDAPGRKTRP